MNQIFQINLDQNEEKLEDFEKDGANLMSLSVQLPSGEYISGNGCRVSIAISVDGMLGLGTELIRKAMRIKSNQTTEIQEHEEVMPISSTGGPVQLGVYLTHDSCELIFGVGNLGTFSKEIKKAITEQ